jgi:hypothetical protein
MSLSWGIETHLVKQRKLDEAFFLHIAKCSRTGTGWQHGEK